MQNKTFTILIILSIMCGKSFSQVIDNTSYVVITYEMRRSVEPKGRHTFYWIAPVDSIKGSDFYLYPLYLSEYSKDNLDYCSSGDTIDIFTRTTGTTYDFATGYESEIQDLISLINTKRRKVQINKINWTKGYKQEITVYVTPIVGKFCRCVQEHLANNKVEFSGFIFLPLSDFRYDYDFWRGEKHKTVIYANYSFIDYSSHLLIYSRGVRSSIE